MNSTVIFCVNPLWKALQVKAYFSLAFYAEKLKNHKIPFLVTKNGQNSKAISLLKTLDVNYIYEFHYYFSPQSALEGPTTKSIFFFSVLCGKAEKSQNTFFGYKKWLKFESDDIFKCATQNLYIFNFYFPLTGGASYL